MQRRSHRSAWCWLSLSLSLALDACVLEQEIAVLDSGARDARTSDASLDGGACRPLNAICTDSDQCCTNRCRAVSLSVSRCIEQALPDAACSPIGANCTGDLFCCSGSCSGLLGDAGLCQ